MIDWNYKLPRVKLFFVAPGFVLTFYDFMLEM